jgi:hypothetical protein
VFATLKSVFDERVVSHGLYPARSLELILHDVFFWGYLK